MDFLKTFRGKLLLILAFMLVASLSVQYYLNIIVQRENEELRDEQSKASSAGFQAGFYSLTGSERLIDLIDQPNQTLLDESALDRILDILIIDNEWRISDSLNRDHLPTAGLDDEIIYKKLADIKDLPPLIKTRRLDEDLSHFPNADYDDERPGNNEAHAVPIETSKGRWYVMVLLKNDRSEAAQRAARPLLVTLVVLMLSTLVTFFLVWRFTRPIAELSNAAHRVAEGDLNVRVPDHNRNDEMGGLIRQFNEMTAKLEDSKDLEEQLQQAERSAVIGRLGSAIAHEIRNPLNYINLTLDHLKSKYVPVENDRKEPFTKLIVQVKDEVARINQQITDFLSYSRPAKPDLKATPADEIIADPLRLIEGLAEESNIAIEIEMPDDIPSVNADKEFLRSVFNNLFINALQSMGNAGGTLGISVLPEKEYVNYQITDTGVGISPDNLEKIFEPYFSTKETGTGLGLAIVQKIVESHNGHITVISEEGKGTVFTVKLPRSAA